ncbi:hypothetical protein CAPI_05535 [Corynebacterium capitovis DSM 44611]|nr:hypothetical protein CAPI_05535 [Corynebacterium capitovis DSM 44611]
MVLAVVFLLLAALAFFRGEHIVAITAREAVIAVAAAIFGANATFIKGQERTRGQVGLLGVAVALLACGAFLPRVVLFYAEPFWLILWAVVAAVCALILRRNAM